MWDRSSVDLGTINAESLKLSNSNPVSGQRRRTNSSEFEPRFTPNPAECGLVSDEFFRAKTVESEVSLLIAGINLGLKICKFGAWGRPDRLCAFLQIPAPSTAVAFSFNSGSDDAINFNGISFLCRYISLSSVNPQRTGSWFQRWRVRRRLQPTSARVYWRVAGARRRAGPLTYP
ncbi:unnamed protein product [Malus baccata var. baccata]